MVRFVVGIIFCVVAFVALFAKISDPRASRHAGEILAAFLFELGMGVTLIIFGKKFLALRKRILAAAARNLQARGEVDVQQIAREMDVPEERVRKILLRTGFSAQVGGS